MRLARYFFISFTVLILITALPWYVRAQISDADADLVSIYQGTGSLSPAFSPSVTEYWVRMHSSAIGYYTAAIPANSGAAMEYSMNGGFWTAIPSYTSTGYLPTNRGDNTFQIKVTSADLTATKTYTIHVYYPSTNDADLIDLHSDEAALSPGFQSSVMNYTAHVPYTTSSITFTGVLDDPAASLTINGTAATNGAASGAIPLNVGSNTIVIATASYDQTANKTYTITVTRAAPSTNTGLSDLTVPGNLLSPAFATGTTAYTLASAAYAADSLTVIPTAADPASTVKVRVNGGSYMTVNSGSASGSLALNVGSNTIEIQVTAQDGITSNVYTITVKRKNNNAALSELLVSPGSLNEAFSSERLDYSLEDAGSTTDTLTVSPVLADPAGASVRVNVNGGGYTPVTNGHGIDVPLTPGSNLITLEVIAEDSGYFKRYTISVTRLQDSAIYPASGIFDKYSSNPVEGHYQDIVTTLTLNGNTLSSIKLDDTILEASSYTLSANTITIHKEYLAALETGHHVIAFVMNKGSNALYTLFVNDTTPPILNSAVAGDGHVQLAWSPVDGSTGYKIYQSLTSGTYGPEVATVTGSTYDFDATGLTNGTTSYFVVKATNPGGDSAVSNELSATPRTVPAAPTDVNAVAGNGQATVSFTAPSDNGGSPIIGYEVTALPGNIIAEGTSSPITVTGLSNGTAYTFTVKAVNSAGKSAGSAVSNEIIPRPSSNAGDGDGTPTNPVTTGNAGTVMNILVNGKAENWGLATTTRVNNQSVTTISLNPAKFMEFFAAASPGTVITIPFSPGSDVVIGEFNGQMIKTLEQNQAVVKIQTDQASYTLPARQIHIESISHQLEQSALLQDVIVQIEIAAPAADMLQTIENAAFKGNFKLLAPPLNFTVRAAYHSSSLEVSRFNAYVERTIAIPGSVDASQSTTGIVVEPGGLVHPVPTQLTVMDGKYYATIKSLSNSTYAIISHPVEFQDTASHWAKSAVNDLGSRMIINGFDNGRYAPDQDITRAEFAAILVRGLGVKLVHGGTAFPDVKASDWYSDAIQTAYAHQFISGFEDGSFHPTDKVTREQAIVMISKAMTLTGLKTKLPAQETNAALAPFKDAANASNWAKESIADCLQSGIVSGRNKMELAPKAPITRAEVAVIIQRFLQKSELI
ncbi:cadherin-like beta sandwich domain-containing protein [Paenibacillus durus]|uniref:cadherin-like beta sandwich domain-containing protein n=1 Tax=Paenibacillus durus TaxID=44251 RepID=UPI000472BB9F|nr:cadherin-like beta sandwich domain-containing protein [Paenibacillus durus]